MGTHGICAETKCANPVYTTEEVDSMLRGKAASSHTHDDRYYTASQVNSMLSGKAASSHTHDDRYYTESEVNNLLSGKAASNHNHDSRYYTETEVNNLLSGKAASSHTHDDRYYTKSEVNNLLAEKQNKNWGVIHNFTHQSGGMSVDKSLTSYNELIIMLTYAGVDIYQTIHLPKSSAIGGQKICLTNGTTKATVELNNSYIDCEILEAGYYVSILGR